MTNLYTIFRGLLPKTPLLVGVVVAKQVGGCTVQLPTGGSIFARGDATYGASVFVRDNVIEGVAPTLSVEIIDV